MKLLSSTKALLAAILLATPLTGAFARTLTPEQALARINGNNGQMRMPSSSRYVLAHTEEAEGSDWVYVFNNTDNGFIIASADDRMPALLGYSDNGTFDPEKVAPALNWWISQYARQASVLDSAETPYTRSDEPSDEDNTDQKTVIPALIQTKWGQNFPFNLDCPEIYDQHCVTGCVATAMAQIIKYHEYPSIGCGTHQYGWNGEIVEFDFGATSFKYEDMLDSYSGESNEAQQQAVATLMNACGISVNMVYDLEGSSASDIYIAYALRHFFNYDGETRFFKRDLFLDEEWENLIYTELKNNRPVIYGGQAPHGGHQFIVDGYDGDGFFHINWGWEGLSDGNFRLSALDPDIQGTGGFEGGYNSDQTVVCGIQPAIEDSHVWYPIYSSGNLKVSGLGADAVNLVIEGGGLYNYSQQAVDAEILLKTIAEDGTVYYSESRPFIVTENGEPTTWLPFPGALGTSIGGYSSMPTINLPENLPAGKYRCTIAFRTPEMAIQDIYFPVTSTSYFNLSINESGIVETTPGQPEVKAEIRVSGFQPRTDAVENSVVEFELTVENIGDISYSGWIEYRIYKDGEQVNETAQLVTFNSIQPGAHPTYILDVALPYPPGIYDFIFFDQYGEQISEPFPVSIGDSAVDAILSESTAFDIYTAGGVLVKKNADRYSLQSLPKGIYILNVGGKAVKILK